MSHRAALPATFVALFTLACAGASPTSAAGGATSDAAATSEDDGGLSEAGASMDDGATSDGETGGVGSDAGPSDSTATDGGGGSTGHPSIDLSLWSLQLPIAGGSGVLTISPKELVAGFHDAYFYVAADGGQVFMDPATGATTSGSVHCRSELREMNASGSQAAWSPTGTNTMTVTGKVLQLGGGSNGHVTVAQVFDGGGGHTLAELEVAAKSGGLGFSLFYEEAKGAGTMTDLHVPVTLGATYTFTMSLSTPTPGTGPVLSVVIDATEVYTHAPTTPSSDTFYFKVGNYDQTATAGPVSTTPYTVVEDTSVSIVHK